MSNARTWTFLIISALLFAFGVLGVMNSVHDIAKIVYAVLIAASALGFAFTLLRAKRTS